MKLFNKIRFFFKKNKIIKSKDSFINTKVIYNTYYNFIILISFSDNYFSDALELITASNNINAVKHDRPFIIYRHSSYIENLPDKEMLKYPRNYLLISGDGLHYACLYKAVENIANPILQAISIEIYQNRDSSEFDDLINDNIFQRYLFKYENIVPVYDDYFIINDKINGKSFDDLNYILEQLPESFTAQSLLHIINVYDLPKTEFEYLSAYDILDKAYNYDNNDCIFLINDYNLRNDFFKLFIKNPTDENLSNLVGPQYLVMDDDEIPGDISDEKLDDIFRQEYDRFNAIKDDNVEYADIDELINEDDETENTSILLK